MSGKHDPAVTLPWMREGTAHLLADIEKLTDDELRAPSALPGWSRAHIVGHLARNAEALGRLAHWARTGVETPVYSGSDQRAADIENSATHPAAVLRSEIATTARVLDDLLDQLDDQAWTAPPRSAQGRDIPATEIPWMRIREVWLHAVDLDTGASTEKFPDGVIDLLLDDVTRALTAKDGCPSLTLIATDRDRHWPLNAAGGPELAAPASLLAGWAAGRSTRCSHPTPLALTTPSTAATATTRAREQHRAVKERIRRYVGDPDLDIEADH